jgi:hypothetical protein
MFSISAKKSLDNVVVKDIKGLLQFMPRPLKFKVSNRKAYLNATAAFSIYTLIIRTKGIKSYIVSLIASL